MTGSSKKSISVNGVVLSEQGKGETDILITLLTDTLGKISVLCRGARVMKSKRFSSIHRFCYSELMLTKKDGMYSLSEGSLKESFFGLRSSLEAMTVADYLTECLLSVTVEEEGGSDGELLRLVLNCLYLLSEKREEKPPLVVKSVFELRLALLLGVMPDLSACSECGKENFVGCLDIANGVLVCSDCLREGIPTGEERVLVPISAETLLAMRYIFSADMKKLFSFKLSPEGFDSLYTVSEKYLTYQIGKSFKSLDFLNSII